MKDFFNFFDSNAKQRRDDTAREYDSDSDDEFSHRGEEGCYERSVDPEMERIAQMEKEIQRYENQIDELSRKMKKLEQEAINAKKMGNVMHAKQCLQQITNLRRRYDIYMGSRTTLETKINDTVAVKETAKLERLVREVTQENVNTMQQLDTLSIQKNIRNPSLVMSRKLGIASELLLNQTGGDPLEESDTLQDAFDRLDTGQVTRVPSQVLRQPAVIENIVSPSPQRQQQQQQNNTRNRSNQLPEY